MSSSPLCKCPASSKISQTNLLFPLESILSPGASQLSIGLPSSPPGYREPDNEETSLSTVLDSLIPFIRDTNSTVQLLVYLGKSVIDPIAGKGEACCSRSTTVGAGKEFAWSRGLGIEHSSVKTRSTQKSQLLSLPLILSLARPPKVGHLEL
jgi:hypothetical protein